MRRLSRQKTRCLIFFRVGTLKKASKLNFSDDFRTTEFITFGIVLGGSSSGNNKGSAFSIS